MIFLCNVFNDPSSPWYYVIGVVFLLLVFGALALYIVLSKKLKKAEEDEKQADGAANAETPDIDRATPDATEPEGDAETKEEQ